MYRVSIFYSRNTAPHFLARYCPKDSSATSAPAAATPAVALLLLLLLLLLLSASARFRSNKVLYDPIVAPSPSVAAADCVGDGGEMSVLVLENSVATTPSAGGLFFAAAVAAAADSPTGISVSPAAAADALPTLPSKSVLILLAFASVAALLPLPLSFPAALGIEPSLFIVVGTAAVVAAAAALVAAAAVVVAGAAGAVAVVQAAAPPRAGAAGSLASKFG